MEKFLLNPRRFKLFLSPQIDPKVAFPRRSNPKVRIASAPRVINWMVLTISPKNPDGDGDDEGDGDGDGCCGDGDELAGANYLPRKSRW